MTRHVGAEALARFREGDLPRWRARRVRSHLDRCARCSELAADLAEVPALLASVPQPALPEQVATRIQGALAQEAQRATASQAAASESRTTAAPAGATTGRRSAWGRRRWDWRLPQLSPAGWPVAAQVGAAAAAVAVLAVGGVEIAEHSGRTAPTAAGPAAGRAVPYSHGRSLGPVLYYSHDGQQYRITSVSTGTDFTPGQLGRQVSQLTSPGSAAAGSAGPAAAPAVTGPAASGSSGAAPQPATEPTGAGGTFRNFSVTSLEGCVNRIAAGNLVVLVDVARYQGSPATVIVTEAAAGGLRQVWVVGTGCSASSSDTLSHTQLASGS